jgi:uncharacterized protein (TIGR02118 family)
MIGSVFAKSALPKGTTMATAIALYNTPTDPAAFDAYYLLTHVPLAKSLPGLRSYDISAGAVLSPSGTAPYHMIAVLRFDTMSDLQAALASSTGQAVVADLENFATGGVSVLFFDDHPV